MTVPASVLRPELETVQSHGFDEVRRAGPPAVDYGTQPTGRQLERCHALRHELLDLGEEHERGEPLDEQQSAVAGGDVDLVPSTHTAVGTIDQLAERQERLDEDGILRRRVDRELDLARVVDESVHGASHLSTEAPRLQTHAVSASGAVFLSRRKSASGEDPSLSRLSRKARERQ